ncbi:hypothetical protein HG697_00870 [Streptococcus dysgalactiae subsp. equisimilis]|nr:hypothetical protein HG697_00870 [Streptococcus dysgalactiae subsp. equisimilis]
MQKMIVWALFDSGNGSYTKAINTINSSGGGRLWKYIEQIIGFNLPHKNPTRYNNYDYPLQKPTKFASNLFLNLNNEIKPAEVEWGNFSKSYNERSNIPQKLLLEIFQTVLNKFEKDTRKNDKN